MEVFKRGEVVLYDSSYFPKGTRFVLLSHKWIGSADSEGSSIVWWATQYEGPEIMIEEETLKVISRYRTAFVWLNEEFIHLPKGLKSGISTGIL